MSLRLVSLAATVAICGAGAQAATLTATSLVPDSFSDFTIEFTDANSNGLLDFDEITAFSGMTQTLPTSVLWSDVVATPDVPGFVVAGGTGGDPDFWTFAEGFGFETGIGKSSWSYEVTTARVPVPAAALLLAGGIGLLPLLRRRG